MSRLSPLAQGLIIVVVIIAFAVGVKYTEAGEARYVDYMTVKQWESVDQFEKCYKGSVTPLRSNQCIEIAKQIQTDALNQGYPVSIALAWSGQYYGMQVTSAVNSSRGHAGLVIEIQGHWYFVDPYPWKMTRLW
jgi:hypothetical protein